MAKLDTLLDAVQRDPQATAIVCAGEAPSCMHANHPTFRAADSRQAAQHSCLVLTSIWAISVIRRGHLPDLHAYICSQQRLYQSDGNCPCSQWLLLCH